MTRTTGLPHFISDGSDMYIPSSSTITAGVLLGLMTVGELLDGSGTIVVAINVVVDVVVVDDVVVVLTTARAVAVVAIDGVVAGTVVTVLSGSFTTRVCLAVTKRVVV